MQREKTSVRILAIDLRMSRFAYAIYEGPRHLLDWGGRASPPSKKRNLAAERVAELLKLFHPAILVMRKDRSGGTCNELFLGQIAEQVRNEAAIRSVPVVILCPEDVRQAFCSFRVRTKDDIAAALTGIFPELLWDLPRKRKKWDNEHPRMAVFDAIALGFAYIERSTESVFSSEE
jgi:hypothetical protein